ncbi:AAA domain-containing protein [Metabacillus halosaccharovorans]|uniref:AAA domain-containing protein n=1 Tax=Metabacillus halosaccharovorans TaxID=930124 RepID=UPI00204259A6|nr:AAA domain-containing protein [Metabacillus halosaccharovorans]MCM3442336.1 AAA domain-containing protein [Metabacillus halosaccharovorans]
MKSTNLYIKLWQKALRAEIIHLKKYGSTKYALKNGQLMSNKDGFTYYFESLLPLKVPVGSSIKVESGKLIVNGRILSSEGKSVILSLEQSLGHQLFDLYLLHDPWELLDQLHDRLDEIKESKRKRARVKRLMNPSNEAKHPIVKIKSPVHELVLRSKYNPVTFVWGPPGTGKTYTLSRVAANKYNKKDSVLVLSQSNQAVDVLMMEITRFIHNKGLYREGDLVRYGSQSMIHTDTNLTTNELIQKRHPDLANERAELYEDRRLMKVSLAESYSRRDSEQLLEIERKLSSVSEKIRHKEIELVHDADIVGTTLAKAATDPTIYEKNFDVVMVDEASMAYVPQIAFAASLGKRIIICGDFKQLPPIASAKHPLVDEWLREDIFHKAGVVEWLDRNYSQPLHPHLFLLKEQRRMHPDISSFTNKYVYNSLVGDHESVRTARHEIVERKPFANSASVLLDSSYTGMHCLSEKASNSRYNLWHLLLSFQIIHEAYISGSRSIGFVTPYRAQAVLMEALLNEIYSEELIEADIISATVHKFQGSERDVMVFDTVDSFPQERPGMLLIGKNSERLVNVAMTRTRGKFIHLADKHFVQSKVYSGKIIRKLVDHQIARKKEVSPHQIGTWIKNQHSRVTWLHAKKLEPLKKDIQQAKSSIMIGIPMEKVLPVEWRTMCDERKSTVTFSIIASHSVSGVKYDRLIKRNVPFPFIIIDQKYLWLGMPYELSENSKPPYVAVRVSSIKLAEYVHEQLIE